MTNALAIVNGRLVLPDRIVEGFALLVDDEKVGGIVPLGELPAELPRFDARGGFVTPGLIDIHTHGAAGHGFDQLDHEAWVAVTGAQLHAGVTTCVASLSTASLARMIESLAFARSWLSQAQAGARVLGVHLEGPYLSPEQRGAQDPRYLREPTDGSVDRLLSADGTVRMVTLAPELPGGLDLVERLARDGVVAALGHSDATEDVVIEALARGATHVTHLWSGMSTVRRVGPWRRPGLLETALASDILTAEIIADARHLPPALLRMAYRCVRPERLCIVSDAVELAGMPEGTRREMDGSQAEVRDGVAIVVDGNSFAGSTTLLGRMVAILNQDIGVPMVDVIRMSTLTPAHVIGAEATIGSLEMGKMADIVVFSDDLQPWQVMMAGRWVVRGQRSHLLRNTGSLD